SDLGNLFTANENMLAVAIVVLAWFVAALVHLAVGSVSVAAGGGAGVLAAVLGGVALNPVVVGRAAAAGGLLALLVNSNFFWMFKSLLGLTTKGALKTMTVSTAISSLVSLPVVIILAMVMPV